MTKDFSALVGSRICHDLISPIGAISNGVELLAMTDGASSAEMSLISESVENANARIRFFRIAFGGAKADQLVSRAEVLSVLAAMAQSGRHTFYWQVEQDNQRRNVRIAFLLLLCMESALPTGGDLTVNKDGDEWVVTAQSNRLKYDPELWDGMIGLTPEIDHTAAQVQFAMLPEIIADSGRKLSVTHTDSQIVARF